MDLFGEVFGVAPSGEPSHWPGISCTSSRRKQDVNFEME